MQAGWVRRCGFLLCAWCLLPPAGASTAQTADDLSRDLKKLIDLGEKAPSELYESLATRIESDPKAASELILPKLRDAKTSQRELVVYVWAVGLTSAADAVDQIITVANARGKESAALQAVCAQALANLGGPKAGAFLLAQLDAAADAEARFELLNLLGQMQYEAALPKTVEILKVDPRELYWQPIFVFGKMGDVGVPFLIKQMNHEERSMRHNAIMVLGRWLIPPEASRPLQKRFWEEDDPEIRRLILSSLERTITDLEAVGRFSQEVVAKEKDEKVRQFAQETLDNMDAMKKELQSFRAIKKKDKARFHSEYVKLYRFAGKEGIIGMLSHVSSLEDEPQLKKLRERILRRNSDEAFYDYQDVNSIILSNRRVYAKPATQPDSSPTSP